MGSYSLFLDELYFPLLGLGTLSGLVVWFQKNTPAWLKCFAPFLLITLITEIVGDYMSDRSINNVLLYNLYSTLEVAFYLLVLRVIIETRKLKIIIAYSTGLYVIVKTFDLLVLRPNIFHFMIYNAGALLIVGFSVYYIYRLFKTSTPSLLVNNPAFWICLGLTVYFAGSLPVWILFGYMQKFSIPFRIRLMQFHLYLNLAIYSLFTIGFLCRVKFRKPVS